MLLVPTPWTLDASSMAMTRRWLQDRVAAASELLSDSPELGAWAAAREAQLNAGELSVIVEHEDLWPGRTPQAPPTPLHLARHDGKAAMASPGGHFGAGRRHCWFWLRPLFAAFQSLTPLAALVALVWGLVPVVTHAERWRCVAHAFQSAPPRATAMAAIYQSSFLNMVLPGGVAGDVLRAIDHPVGTKPKGGSGARW
ncbi:lysylphosphatidylglycerol synthase domain-containing protein [Ornithinimicrobium sp. INDO-MA30-4]|uniref:lysylphosphatidylglycerol synthase domain-containing protein n=1 Tax=Ornithinimicrobium sp. INDO-MA30-4 TaxID=2908651 RepID=UPI001F426F49|nr:lysylphosphatidylglycerol synthase domain-containing protein [Ornithinimicrobium sp. INDO-MA30-4]UJH70869.1 flippase-like domain-containing protein [Ornithinimicrobium sp. INDO-MA30-4]